MSTAMSMTSGDDRGDKRNADFRKELLSLVGHLKAFAHSLCGDRDKADDLLQETLCKAWQCRESFVPGSNLKAWTFTILRHLFYSGHRRAKWQGPWDQDEAERIPDSQTDQFGSAELSDTLRALQVLSPKMRQSLLLVGVGGYSCEETAAICAVATGTVKSRVARARRALNAAMDGKIPLPPRTASRLHRGNGADQIVAEFSRINVLPGGCGSRPEGFELSSV
jgi:RNA polymerase sigma-70 factor (ECF subfamily)